MLLFILFHLLLNEAKRAVDDLLIKLQLCFLLVQVFLGSSDLDRVEVKQLVLLLEQFEETLSLYALVKDLILLVTTHFDLLLVQGLHSLSFLLDIADLFIKNINLSLGLFPFLGNISSYIELLLALLSDLLVKLFDLSLIFSVSFVGFLDNADFLLNVSIHILVFLLIHDCSHSLDIFDRSCCCFKPLAI